MYAGQFDNIPGRMWRVYDIQAAFAHPCVVSGAMPEKNGGNMTKRLPYLMLMLFLAVLAVPLRASPIGAVVQTWHYDPQTKLVTAQIVNESNKDITPYNISIKETYADAHVKSHALMTDTAGGTSSLHELTRPTATQ